MYLRERFLRRAAWASAARTSAWPRRAPSCVVESEGNGRMCTTLPHGPDHRHGDREAGARAARTSRSSCSSCRARSDGRAHEPLHVAVDRRDRRATGRRSSTSSCSTTDARRRWRDEVGRQALRCIRCSACLNVCPVYARVGRPRLRLGLSGPDRRDPDAAARGHRARRLAALRLQPLRRLLRRLPGEDRHPVGAAAPARRGGARESVTAGAGRVRRRSRWLFQSPRRFALRAAARTACTQRPAAAPRSDHGWLPGTLGGWTRGRDLRPVARETFREWWSRERGA